MSTLSNKCKNGLLSIALLSILLGCSIVQIQKRQYRKGYSVHWNLNRSGQETQPSQTKTRSSGELADKPESESDGTLQDNPESDEAPGEKGLDTLLATEQVIENQPSEEAITSQIHRQDKGVRKRVDEEELEPDVTHLETKNDSSELRSKRNSNQNSNWQYLGLLTAMLSPMLFLSNKRIGRSKKWAAQNKWKSRFVIGVASAGIGFGVTVLTGLLGWTLSPFMIALPLLAGVLGFAIKGRNGGEKSPRKENWATQLIMLSGFGMFAFPASVLEPVYEPPMHVGLAIILTVLVVSMLITLLLIALLLSCTLACNGTPYLALVLAFASVFVLTMLAFLLIFYFYDRSQEGGRRRRRVAAIVAAIMAAVTSIPFILNLIS